jgi:hypothetical protein
LMKVRFPALKDHPIFSAHWWRRGRAPARR